MSLPKNEAWGSCNMIPDLIIYIIISFYIGIVF